MYGRITTKRKMIVSILLLVAAALFVVSFANTTLAAEGAKLTLKGEVVAISPDTKTLTVKSAEAEGMKGEISFILDDDAKVTACGESKAFGDIKIGDHITVTYYDKEGKSIADAIALSGPYGMYGNECS